MKLKSTSLLAFALVGALSSPLQAALVAYYSFDEDFTDGSGNNNHLSAVESGGATVAISDTASEFVFGGGAADFNSTTGNQAYLTLTTAINFGAADPWSVSFWVRRRADSDNRQGMVLGEVGSGTNFFWASDNSAQVQGMRFRSDANTNANFDVGADDGEFHHWVLTSDGAGTISAYWDSEKQDDVSTTGSINITSIGHAFNQTIHSMNGQIDELYIFDEAIDQATVNSLFTSNVIPEPGSIVLLGLGGLLFLRRKR